VAMRCWKSDPESRPKADELLDIISDFNHPDDRLPDRISQRKKIAVTIDYDSILSILTEVSNIDFV
jgi:hypothetical protein